MIKKYVQDLWNSRRSLSKIEGFDHAVVNTILGACGDLPAPKIGPSLPFFVWQCGKIKVIYIYRDGRPFLNILQSHYKITNIIMLDVNRNSVRCLQSWNLISQNLSVHAMGKPRYISFSVGS